MHRSNKSIALLLLVVMGSSAVTLIASDKSKKKSKASTAMQQMDEPRRALHVLNRFTFGPRPGQVQAVEAQGVDRWFEQQLHPEKIDDSQLEARLSQYRTLKMD